jgi:hypothetical protein
MASMSVVMVAEPEVRRPFPKAFLLLASTLAVAAFCATLFVR